MLSFVPGVPLALFLLWDGSALPCCSVLSYHLLSGGLSNLVGVPLLPSGSSSSSKFKTYCGSHELLVRASTFLWLLPAEAKAGTHTERAFCRHDMFLIPLASGQEMAFKLSSLFLISC